MGCTCTYMTLGSTVLPQMCVICINICYVMMTGNTVHVPKMSSSYHHATFYGTICLQMCFYSYYTELKPQSNVLFHFYILYLSECYPYNDDKPHFLPNIFDKYLHHLYQNRTMWYVCILAILWSVTLQPQHQN